ncbi:MAG TPA: DUF1028 domain-containing protein [Actinocatenispora sp.]
MTFSIVARGAGASGRTAYGVAVASRFLAVGAAVPAVDPVAGALATQAMANLAYRPQGLALLRTGTGAADVVAGLTAADPQRADRQLGVVAATGDGATYTGPNCLDWAGGTTGDGFAVQGNILAGPGVVDAMRTAYLAAEGPLARRLLAALRAGDEAGGDRRGRQSAALLVAEPGAGYGGLSDIAVDLRVDDHTDPVTELARLLDAHHLYFDRPDEATLLDLSGELAAEVAGRLARLGHTGDDALAEWAGIENYEERLVSGKIDPLVLEQLRAATEET